MFITAKNYRQHKPDRASLTPGQRDVYDAIEETGEYFEEFYQDDADYRATADMYFEALNRSMTADIKKGKVLIPEEEAAPAAKASKKRKTVAQRKAAPTATPAKRHKAGPPRFKLTGDAGVESAVLDCETVTHRDTEGDEVPECVVRARCNGQVLYFFIDPNPNDLFGKKGPYVTAVAAEGDDLQNPYDVDITELAAKRAKLYGADVLAFYKKAWRTKEKNDVLIEGRKKYRRDGNLTKKAAQAVSQRNEPAPAPAAKPKPAPALHVVADRYWDSDKKEQATKPYRDAPTAKFGLLDRVQVLRPSGGMIMARQAEKAGRVGTIEARYCMRWKSNGKYIYGWLYYVVLDGDKTSGMEQGISAGWVYAWRENQIVKVTAPAPAPAAASKHPKRQTAAQRKAAGKPRAARHQKPVKLVSTPEGYAAVEPTPAPAAKPKATRTRTKKEKAPKAAPKPKKVKVVDTRTLVSHFDNDVLFMKEFLKLEGKPATFVQVQALHRKLEKNIEKQHVRKTSPYADDIAEIASLVAKTYQKMVEAEITTVGKLEYDNPVVGKVRRHVEQLRLDGALNLVSRFINMQGTVPEAKAVKSLLTALDNEHAENPKGVHVVAIGAAAAVLRDWQPGRPVAISQQQLGRLTALSGLGCPGTPAKPCGCKKAGALAGAPDNANGGIKTTTPNPNVLLADSPDEEYVDDEEYEEEEEEDNSIFSAIGQKDSRRPVGETLHLGTLGLGRFLGGEKGEIERHEYAFALRGDPGAGKTRFQYQILNLFASIGLSCALFSLEIDKNSDLIAKHTRAYIAAENRPRVRIASETPNGLTTIEEAAQQFDVVAIDSWGKIPGVKPTDFDVLRKKYPRTLFIVIFQSTTNGTNRGGSSSEFDASAVCHVQRPGIARCEKNRYATGAADELGWNVNDRTLIDG